MQSVLVTGATDGIGRATARALLARGWHVLVHGRNEAKARKAANGLASAEAKATPVWGDFANMADVVDLSIQVKAEVSALDVLVNNAGIYSDSREINPDGFEMTMAVNYFAPFLLTHHLLANLTCAPNARIVNVSSMTHSGASLDLDDLRFERGWSSYAAYSTSKLADILFTRRLAADLDQTRVTANALHPGVVGTKLLRQGFGMGGESVEDGARCSVFLATSPKVARVSGKYFVDCKEHKPSAKARDDRLGLKLWDTSLHLLEDYL
jgi:retinol dehydrogenase-12